MMTFNSPVEMIEVVAEGLGDLLDKVVFVGGAVASLYYEDAAATRIRPTADVDCVVEVMGRLKYGKLEDELRLHGFRNDMTQGAPLCRWIYGSVTVDVMPIDEQILGFSNRWYGEGMHNAITVSLPSGKTIAILSLPYFVATKLEAFKNRGEGDFRMSHDIEDIVTVLDSRDNFEDMYHAPESVKRYLQDNFRIMTLDDHFLESVAGYIGYAQTSAGRAVRIIEFMKKYSGIV